MKFPVEFNKCPLCKKPGTLYMQAVKEDLSPPKKPYAFLEKKISPVQDFMGISLLNTRVLVRHFDTCAHCGFEYCVRAEILPMPTNLLMQMMGVSLKMPQGK